MLQLVFYLILDQRSEPVSYIRVVRPTVCCIIRQEAGFRSTKFVCSIDFIACWFLPNCPNTCPSLITCGLLKTNKQKRIIRLVVIDWLVVVTNCYYIGYVTG